MLYIDKKTAPEAMRREVAKIKSSSEWRNIKDCDTKALRAQFDLLPKEAIRNSLLQEQHYLCAYCMKRLRNEELHMTIEHWFPLSKDKEKALDYQNMLGVCKGGSDLPVSGKRILCCDGSKEDEDEMVINPLNKHMMNQIAYRKDGTIYFMSDGWDSDTVSKIETDINKTLRLNGKLDINGNLVSDTSTELLKGRRDAYRKYQTIIQVLTKQKELTSTKISKEIHKITKADMMNEFDGVLLFFLNRKYKHLQAQGK